MTNYPFLLYMLEPGSYLYKSLHFIPAGMKSPDTGITIFCRKNPYLDTGELDPEVKELIRQISRDEQVRSGMLVCTVFGPADCEYLTPEGIPLPSTEPPRLGPNHLENDRDLAGNGENVDVEVPSSDHVLNWIRSQLGDQPVH